MSDDGIRLSVATFLKGLIAICNAYNRIYLYTHTMKYFSLSWPFHAISWYFKLSTLLFGNMAIKTNAFRS